MNELGFPKTGKKADLIIEELSQAKNQDIDWKRGRVFSLVYHVNEEHHQFIQQAHNAFFSENALNPMCFRSLRKFEHETIKMCADLFHGDQNTVGVVTSGGTESLLMMLKTYRDKARKNKPWILRPEIIIPETAHSAIDKGAQYFDLKVRHAKVGADFRVDLKSVKSLINRNTILIVGSAPQYPHGVIDPIAQLADLAHAEGIAFHVDACIGGFILPFMEKLGHGVPPFDFRLQGVTSLSADLHKYGYTAKGASVLLYRDMSIMKHQFFIHADWKGGGIYASPSFPGTRPGGPIACAWATLQKIGESGYLELTQKVLAVRDHFLKEMNTISELEVVAHPDASIVAIASKDKDISIYAIADQLQTLGWAVDRQQDPQSIHLTFSPVHEISIRDYVKDLKTSIKIVRENPALNTTGQAAMYGMMAEIPFKGMVHSSVLSIMEKMYGANSMLPDSHSGEVESWSDLLEKVGKGFLTLKRQVHQLWDETKSKSDHK
jgi:sphinganine-1-phosphate aldolase